eukprot:1905006-Rhodomonas_salina.2
MLRLDHWQIYKIGFLLVVPVAGVQGVIPPPRQSLHTVQEAALYWESTSRSVLAIPKLTKTTMKQQCIIAFKALLKGLENLKGNVMLHSLLQLLFDLWVISTSSKQLPIQQVPRMTSAVRDLGFSASAEPQLV